RLRRASPNITTNSLPPPSTVAIDHESSDVVSHAYPHAIQPQGLIPRSVPSASLAESYELGIPSTLVSILVDLYYSNVYNASLLLNRRLFLESLASGSISPHVILGVCAWASNFYRDSISNQPTLKEQGFSTEWATRASKLVFQEVETPNEDNIVTFLNLGLFWYSQGDWRRAFIL
ncbi:hypothetical protein DH86_00002115, partial [Scytalidium sp. 3C]